MTRITLGKLANVPESLKHSVSQTKVEYRRLGTSGLRVSNPILGGMSIGDARFFPWCLDEAQALPLLKAAYDRGINTVCYLGSVFQCPADNRSKWDTANVYSNGVSEQLFGKALRQYQIPRRKVVLMTKCYRVVSDSENHHPGDGLAMHHELADRSKDYVNQWGLSRAAIFNAVEESLERMQTNYIDLLQIHRFDDTVEPTETMQALHDLVRSGSVRYIGASSMWTYQFATLQHIADQRGWTKFISMQNHYNLLYREEEREMIRFCDLNGIGLIPWAPFASGRLVRPPNQEAHSVRAKASRNGMIYQDDSDDSRIIIDRVYEIAQRRQWPMSHVSLAWLGRRVTAPIVGFSSIGRIDDALEARGKVLSQEEEAYLEAAYRPKAVQGHT